MISLYLLAFALVVVVVVSGMRFVVNSAEAFYQQADKVEQMINENDDYHKVADEVRKLEALTFHQTTHQRLYLIKKLYYMKYGTFITKENKK